MRALTWVLVAGTAVGLALFLTSLAEGPLAGRDTAAIWTATAILVAASLAGIYYDLSGRRR